MASSFVWLPWRRAGCSESLPKGLVRTFKGYWNRPEFSSKRLSAVPFLFEDCTLDLDRRELMRASAPVPVGPQVFDLLAYLVKNRDRVVSKDDLFETVWQGRAISDSTLTSHINAARKAIGDNGNEQRLIRTISRKGFRFVGAVRHEEAPTGSGPENLAAALTPTAAPALPDKPSIAVLPFQNLSGDPGQDYFADGVVEDIIAALSRMRWLFVIARNSSFTYKGRAVDVKQVGRELGVRYVLEGSMRKAANRVRISGQLIDASKGVSLWADRFEGALTDIFDLQDQITTSVVGAIGPRLESAEMTRAKHKPTESLDAYDYYLRGMANFHQRTKDAIGRALPQFYKAIELDPDFATAYGIAAQCYFWRKINGWMTDRQQEIAEGLRLARRAVDLGKDDAVALARGGHSIAHLSGDLDAGITYIDRALVLNPNLAIAWQLGGFLRLFYGQPDAGSEYLARSIRLSPLDPEMFRAYVGTAYSHFYLGRFEEALLWGEKALRELPTFLPAAGVIAASHALAGRRDEAEHAMRYLRELDPTLRISNLRQWWPLRRPEDVARFEDGLRKAGLPE
jgi:TolB-like protein/tetratricopeptide (TPR) repeat protein